VACRAASEQRQCVSSRKTDAERIMGHTVEGETFGTYSSNGPGLKVLAGVIELITYPGLKLSK
jgi:hypothetical protein